jgi:hypothetical protein
MELPIISLDAGSVIPDPSKIPVTGIRDRHDGPGSSSKDVVDFKSRVLKPLVLQMRVVQFRLGVRKQASETRRVGRKKKQKGEEP